MTIRAALTTPLSGPLAMYGRAGAAALGLLDGFDLTVIDAHPDPAAAMVTAVSEHPDVVFGPYGSSPALAAVGATERVVWNHGGSNSALAWSRYPNTVNVLAPARRYYEGTVAAVRAALPDARTVTLVHAETGFGADVAGGAAEAAAGALFSVRTVSFPPGQAGAAAAQVGPSDVLMAVGAFEDEIALAEALIPGRWRAAAFIGAGTDEVLAALGDRREGLLGVAQWMASDAPPPELGPDGTWFGAAYRQATGEDPPYPAAQAFAAGVLAVHSWDAGGGTDDGMLSVARSLDTTTCFGRFRLDPVTGLQAGHEPLTVQWQDGARRVVWPPEQAEAPIRL